MDIRKPENIETAEKSIKHETEMAESRIRSFERTDTPKPEVVDNTMIDKAGHPITIRNWESRDGVYVRAYEIGRAHV